MTDQAHSTHVLKGGKRKERSKDEKRRRGRGGEGRRREAKKGEE